MKTRITSRIPHIAIMLPDMINTQSLQWAKSMGVTAEEIGCSITTDTSGNVYNYLQKKTGGYPMKPIPPFLLIIIFIFVSLFVTAQTTWKNSGPGGGSDLHFLKFDPTNENILYASGDIEGIFKTTDGGLSWQNINNNLARLPYGGNVYWTNDIVIDPQNSQKIYLCGGAGLWRSSNGGQQWDSLFVNYANDEPTMVSTIAVNSSNTNIIYMGLGDRTEGSFADYEPIPAYGGRTGLYKSTDGGTSWNKLNIPGFDTASIYSIHIVNENSDTILISTAKGIYRSLNGGASWTVANNGLPHTNCYMLKGTNISGTYTLFLTVRTLGTPGNVASFSGGFFRSDDFGNSWTDITSDLPKYEPTDSMFLDYWRFDINPSNPAHILIATTRGSHWDEAGIYGTWDADSSVPTWDLVFYPFHGGWMDSAFFIDPYVFDIVFSPSNPAKVAYCEEHVSISNDTGTTWQQKFTTQQGANKWKGNGLELMNTDAIAFHPTNPDVYFIGYDDFGLFRTDDNANSFSRLDPKQSPDYAPLPPLDGVKDIIIDPQIPTDIYISRWGGSQGDYIADYPTGGILYSSDNGNTFTSRVGSLPEGRCDLAMDMQSGAAGSRTLYCAVYYSGIYKTTNSGQSWTSVNTGFGAEAGKVWQIVIDPNNNQTLYAGLNTRGNGNIGIYKSTNGGQNWSLLNNTPAGDVLSLFVDNAGKIYAGITDNFDYYTSGGLYRSADGGNSWSEILDHSRVIDVQVHPLDTTIIVATGSPWYQYDDISPLGIHLTTDGGLSWQDVSAGINHTFFNFARFNPNRPQQLLVGTAGGGLWITDSLGISLGMSDVKTGKEMGMGIIVSPNPFSGQTVLQTDNTLNNATFTVYNYFGLTVKQIKNINGKTIILHCDNLPGGLYFAQITQDNEVIATKKIIITD